MKNPERKVGLTEVFIYIAIPASVVPVPFVRMPVKRKHKVFEIDSESGEAEITGNPCTSKGLGSSLDGLGSPYHSGTKISEVCERVWRVNANKLKSCKGENTFSVK